MYLLYNDKVMRYRKSTLHAILHYAGHIRNKYSIECTLYIAECTVFTI